MKRSLGSHRRGSVPLKTPMPCHFIICSKEKGPCFFPFGSMYSQPLVGQDPAPCP